MTIKRKLQNICYERASGQIQLRIAAPGARDWCEWSESNPQRGDSNPQRGDSWSHGEKPAWEAWFRCLAMPLKVMEE